MTKIYKYINCCMLHILPSIVYLIAFIIGVGIAPKSILGFFCYIILLIHIYVLTPIYFVKINISCVKTIKQYILGFLKIIIGTTLLGLVVIFMVEYAIDTDIYDGDDKGISIATVIVRILIISEYALTSLYWFICGIVKFLKPVILRKCKE